MDDDLMTVQQFNNAVAKWAMKIRRDARATLSAGTHSSGNLAAWLSQYVDKATDGGKYIPGAAYKVAFSFPRYGAFRAYGAGRGWVRHNGVLVRGFRARTEREIRNKQWNRYTTDLLKKGYTRREINRYKFVSKNQGRSTPRTPLDWIDQHIVRQAPELAGIAMEFYADQSLEAMLRAIEKATIAK